MNLFYGLEESTDNVFQGEWKIMMKSERSSSLCRNSSVKENENIILTHVEWNWFRDFTDIYTSLPGGFPGGSEGKASACKAENLSSIPRSGRSLGEGNGNPLQYYRLENPMDRGAWYATVHGVANSRTRLSNFTHFTHSELSWVGLRLNKEQVLGGHRGK